jgi:predicted  nucleic acid-binding Zn-ribbon protein
MVQKNNQEYYVSVEEPVLVRRVILESSRLMIHLLQDYEKLKILRNEKNEKIQVFDKLIKEINSLMLKLKSELPSVPQQKGKKSKKVQISKEQKISKPIKIEKVVPRQKSALESLEDELRSIEDQLSRLG